jgi:hypothetical protein
VFFDCNGEELKKKELVDNIQWSENELGLGTINFNQNATVKDVPEPRGCARNFESNRGFSPIQEVTSIAPVPVRLFATFR